jgi:hypothetical protein
MSMIRIYVDFQNLDLIGRARLNLIGSIQDLNRQGVVLKPGIAVQLYGDEFELPGIVELSEEEHIWVARFDWANRLSLEESQESSS